MSFSFLRLSQFDVDDRYSLYLAFSSLVSWISFFKVVGSYHVSEKNGAYSAEQTAKDKATFFLFIGIGLHA
jgi:hypothetical protein